MDGPRSPFSMYAENVREKTYAYTQIVLYFEKKNMFYYANRSNFYPGLLGFLDHPASDRC